MFRLPFGLTPRPRNTGVRYADVYPRAIASAIDLAFLFLILNKLFLYTRAQILSHVDREIFMQVQQMHRASEMIMPLWNSHFIVLELLSYTFEITVIGIVYVAVQCVFGITPGKWLMGLKIVRRGTLEPVAKWRYALRFIGYIPSVAPLMIGLFWASFNKERRAWQDYIAGTVVIHARPEGWYIDVAKKYYRRWREKRSG